MNGSKILVCNDDGIDSPGLKAAAEAVMDLGELVVVAPKHQQTGAGRSLTTRPEAVLEPVDFRLHGRLLEAYQVDCSPARLVQHSIPVLFPERLPGLLVSGINYGENLGTTITSSGTVGAALQAASLGVPAMAVSRQTRIEHYLTHGELDWVAARHFTHLFAAKLLNQRLAPDVDVLNVNVPATADPTTAWRLTRVSRQPYFFFEIREPSPRSRVKDGEVHINVNTATLEADSDIHALTRDQVVSVTPLSLDLTSRIDIGELTNRLQ